jgi:hypothetical protein
MEGFFDNVKALVMLVNVVDHEEWDVGNGQVRWATCWFGGSLFWKKDRMTLDFFGQEEVVPTMIHILSILKSKCLSDVGGKNV